MEIAARLPHMVGVRSLSDWAFKESASTRDPRLDFMRGFVFVILIANHLDYFSFFMYLTWERFGVVSSAETFISLAGIVTGVVFGRKMKTEGLAACMPPLIDRAIDLYKINFIVVLLIGLLRYVPWIDTLAVTTFYDPYAGIRYPLYPPVEAGVMKLLRDALLLQCGPHQFQIMGMYAVLFFITPAILFMLDKRRVGLLSILSVMIYLINFGTPETQPGTAQIRITGAQFEYGFPVTAWQLLYVHSVIAGFYKQEILDFFYDRKNHWILWTFLAASLAFMVFSLNHPIDAFPAWAQLSWIPGDKFNKIYHTYFAKYNLGPGRFINHVVLFVAIFALLTVLWKPIQSALGWFFIPLGQESLYVFVMHVFLLLLISNTPLPGMNNIWVNTVIHASALAAVWLMVKHKFLFRWVPR
jgi:hypothetical protein